MSGPSSPFREDSAPSLLRRSQSGRGTWSSSSPVSECLERSCHSEGPLGRFVDWYRVSEITADLETSYTARLNFVESYRSWSYRFRPHTLPGTSPPDGTQRTTVRGRRRSEGTRCLCSRETRELSNKVSPKNFCHAIGPDFLQRESLRGRFL